jgi:pimeloyl-ACP methyl ester carboxylesterase
VDGPVDWVGNAWGGHVGTVFAAAAPGRCRSLTAIGTPVRALSAAEYRKIKLLLAVYRVTGPAPLVKTLTRALLGPDADSEASAIVGDAFRGADRKGMATAIRSISLARTDLTPILPRVTAPTLLVAGAEDAMWTPSEARESASHLPHGAVATLPGRGHVAPLLHDAPELAGLIIDFWNDPARYVAAPHAAEIT